MTGVWTAAQLAGIAGRPLPARPRFDPAHLQRIGRLDLWDFWPLQRADGLAAEVAGGELWFALSTDVADDPELRHARARLRLLHRAGGSWRDLGDALPDGLSPGSREWSGSAIVDDRGNTVTLFFTAAGRRGEARTTFEQRLFETRGQLRADGRIDGWSTPAESVASDGRDYMIVNQSEGSVGTIKAFRDPGYFRDPADGTSYLLFAASLAKSGSAFNGAVGLARADDATLDHWTLLPPLLHAEGVNNELERPHIVVRDGRYYLFWSTQQSVFAAGIDAPTGLYGMTAPSLFGPWVPLNGSGLVFANSPAAPMQAYSWLVLPDLRVSSFVDRIATADGRDFGGMPAPEYRLTLDGDLAW